MRLLFLLSDLTRSHGPLRTARDTVTGLVEAGVDAEGLFITPQVRTVTHLTPNVTLFPLNPPEPSRQTNRWLARLSALLLPFRRTASIHRAIEEALPSDTYDLILWRYPRASFQLALRMWRSKTGVVFQHHTMELHEIVSKPPSLNRHYLLWSERLFSRFALKRARGIVGVTSEITQYEVARSGNPHLAACTVTNGIDTRSMPLRSPPDFDGQHLVLLMLIGSAVSWHGQDRVIRGLADYRGGVRISLVIVGSSSARDVQLVEDLGVQDLVEFVGVSTGPALDLLFDRAHLGVASLAIHRKGLTQAAPLKTREYAARGLPIILGYRDPDLDDAFHDVCLQVPADDSPVDMDGVVEFAHAVYRDSTHAATLRSLCEQRLDVRRKTRDLASFLTEVAMD